MTSLSPAAASPVLLRSTPSTLPPADVTQLSNVQVAALKAAQIAGLSEANVKALSAAQIALLSKTAVAGFNGTQIGLMSSTQVAALKATQIGGLTASAIGGLTADDVQALSAAQVGAIGAASLKGITTTAMAALSGTQVNAIPATAVKTLSADQQDNLFRYWVKARTGHYPSEAQLQQLHEQLLHSSADAQPAIPLQQWVIERQRQTLCIRPLSLRLPPTKPLVLEWQGEHSLALPEWQGQLVFATGEGVGIDPDLLRSGPLSLRARTGGERVQLHPKRPSRTLKNLFQESEISASQRPWLPLLYVGERLVFAAGLGMDVRAGSAEGGVALRWEALP